ncbi:MAG: class I SAM-dependent methyltransferase [Proteobacteria bacterium]|nr:class I SAM-dependent methyltransferase [Pseudomonadota bacterium]
MTGGGHEGFLGAVYEAKKPADVAALYDKWAATYEAEMAQAGYRHPSICLALLARHLPRGDAPILDAGAGTGLIGEWLRIAGYPEVEALDISEGMLAVARLKQCYTGFHCMALGGALPFADGAYAGIVSAGVFTSGHVGPEGLDELVRICRRGGVIVLTVKGTLWDGGFSARVDAFAKAGRVMLAEVTEPYVSMPGEVATTPSRAVVLKVV